MSLRSLAAPLALSLLFPLGCSSSDDPVSTIDTGTPDDTSVAPDTNPVTDSAIPDTLVEDTSMPDTRVPTDTAASETVVPDSKADGDAGDAADARGVCVPGATQSEPCGKCGTHTRLCAATRTWQEYGACYDETGDCVPGSTDSVGCDKCGTRPRTCTSTCTWTLGACTGMKACSPGYTETQTGTCLDATKVKTRTCSATCEFGDWTDCT